MFIDYVQTLGYVLVQFRGTVTKPNGYMEKMGGISSRQTVGKQDSLLPSLVKFSP